MSAIWEARPWLLIRAMSPPMSIVDRCCQDLNIQFVTRKVGKWRARLWRKSAEGPSVMSGYFRDEEATQAVLSEDGWLDTGDIGYRVGDNIYITARSKDVIIIKGRNIWPNDMGSRGATC